MKAFIPKVRRFLASEEGPTAVEYSVLLGLIILICFAAIQAVGTRTNTMYNNIVSSMPSS